MFEIFISRVSLKKIHNKEMKPSEKCKVLIAYDPLREDHEDIGKCQKGYTNNIGCFSASCSTNQHKIRSYDAGVCEDCPAKHHNIYYIGKKEYNVLSVMVKIKNGYDITYICNGQTSYKISVPEKLLLDKKRWPKCNKHFKKVVKDLCKDKECANI